MKSPDELPTPEMLRRLLEYDPETGILRWKTRTPDLFTNTEKRSAEWACKNWNAKFAGTRALASVDSSGYNQGRIFGIGIATHRVVWAIVKGAWPVDQIDHINCRKTDNRFINLRDVSRSQNQHNTKKNAKNTSGFKGVWYSSAAKKWQARINVRGVSIHLGVFAEISDAAAAYAKASADLHGEFGRTE